MTAVIVVAGVRGNLGHCIAQSLIKKKAKVRGLVRRGSQNATIPWLKDLGVEIVEVDYLNRPEMVQACRGSSCVVSALSGLREGIIDAQKSLLDAAVEAQVPRFIPSDFSMDYTHIPQGENRNLALRKEFHGLSRQSPDQGDLSPEWGIYEYADWPSTFHSFQMEEGALFW